MKDTVTRPIIVRRLLDPDETSRGKLHALGVVLMLSGVPGVNVVPDDGLLTIDTRDWNRTLCGCVLLLLEGLIVLEPRGFVAELALREAIDPQQNWFTPTLVAHVENIEAELSAELRRADRVH